jgi:hypothetical protein
MRIIKLAAILLGLASTALIAPAHGQTIRQSRPNVVIPVGPPEGRKSVQASPVVQALNRPRAPDMVGLSLDEAHDVLSPLGLSSKIVYVETLDDSVSYNHVGSQIPAAGAFVNDDVVIVQVPRPASRVFAGALSLIDVVRRDGFDLDEGHYEQIYRGADMVLRQDPGKGLFVEPSDGATFAVPGFYGVTDRFPGGLGSAPNYYACSQAVMKSPARYLNLPGTQNNGEDLLFCARTSRGQIAVVQFRKIDMTCCGTDNFKFYVAIFPVQKGVALRSRKAGVTR